MENHRSQVKHQVKHPEEGKLNSLYQQIKNREKEKTIVIRTDPDSNFLMLSDILYYHSHIVVVFFFFF